MSSTADATAATLALFNTLYTENYCAVAASSLFLYEAVVQLDQEVACLWTTKPTGASLLFFANKYISTTNYVMLLARFASFPSDKRWAYGLAAFTWNQALMGDIRSCSVVQNAIQALDALQLVPGAIFSALRAYVLSRSKLLGLVVLALSLAPVGANLVVYGYDFSGVNLPPPFGCLQTDNLTTTIGIRFGSFRLLADQLILTLYNLKALSSSQHRAVVVVSRVPLIIADMLLISTTWVKLSSRGAMRNIRRSKRLSLSDILFRDGTIYFLVLFMLNVLHLSFSLTAMAGDAQGTSYLTLFTSPLTAILISRFLLDLQEANQLVVRLDPDDPLHSSRDPYDDTPTFIASLGAYIDLDLPAPAVDNTESPIGSRLDGDEECRA